MPKSKYSCVKNIPDNSIRIETGNSCKIALTILPAFAEYVSKKTNSPFSLTYDPDSSGEGDELKGFIGDQIKENRQDVFSTSLTLPDLENSPAYNFGKTST